MRSTELIKHNYRHYTIEAPSTRRSSVNPIDSGGLIQTSFVLTAIAEAKEEGCVELSRAASNNG